MHKNLLLDFYKQHDCTPLHYCEKHGYEFRNEPTGLSAESLNNAMLIAFKMPPERAIEYLKKRFKNLIPTSRWDEMTAIAHDKAFTVAKVMTADLLQDFYNLVETAKAEGWDLTTFQNEALPYAEKTGWTGNKLHRLKIIYDTNMQVSYAKGQYQGMKLLGDQGLRPYWEWLPSKSMQPNPLHIRFYGLVLPYDDPFWKIHYPRSRWGCKCGIHALSTKEIQDRGLEIKTGNNFLTDLTKNDLYKQLIEQEQKSSLNLLEAWEPQTNIYVKSIGDQLKKMLVKS